MKYNQTSRFAKFLPVLPLLLAAQSFAATTMITFTDARLDRATVSFGTITSVTTTVNGTNNPATISYTVSGLNLDDDGNDTDSVTVTLNLTGINGAPVVQNTANGRVGIVGLTNEIESAANEAITYSFGTITASSSSGSAPTFNGDFELLTLQAFGAGEAVSLTSTGGTAFTSLNGAGSIPIATTGDTAFTFTPTAAGTAASKGSIVGTNFIIAVPEPSSTGLLMGSLLFLGAIRRRR